MPLAGIIDGYRPISEVQHCVDELRLSANIRGLIAIRWMVRWCRIGRLALDKNDTTPVLKWVQKKDEGQIIAAFKQTVVVRAKGNEARDLADRYFFETLVRIHRQSEGEGFTGLKLANNVDPSIALGDKALQVGSVKELANHMSSAVSAGIEKRFDNAYELKKHAKDSVDAGRKYVAAYVDYIHFVESVHRLVAKGASHAHQQPTAHSRDD